MRLRVITSTTVCKNLDRSFENLSIRIMLSRIDPCFAKKPKLGPGAEMFEADATYSLFTKTEKWCIVGMVSYAALCSNIGSFIYYPALDLLAKTFSVSVSQINLAITSYMAVATVAPTLAGDFADLLGRRPAFLVTLSIFVAADICLALAKLYKELLDFRVL
jgi:hypothetical protein